MNQPMGLRYSRYRQYFLNVRHYTTQPATQMSLAFSFSLLLIAFFLSLALRPTLIKIGELRKEIEESEKVLRTLKEKNATMVKVAKLMQEVETYLPYLDQSVPTGANYQTFLKELEVLGARNQVTLEAQSLGPSLLHAETAKANEKTPGENVPLSVVMSVGGEYPTVTRFLKDIGYLDRLVSVEGLSFTRLQTQEGVSDQYGLTMQLRGSAYYLGNPDLLTKILSGKE